MMQSPISLAEIKLTLLAANVDYELLDECLIWAFGSTELPIKEWKDQWNSKHSDLFEMKGTDTVFDCVYQIGIEFVKEQENQKQIDLLDEITREVLVDTACKYPTEEIEITQVEKFI